MKDRHLRQSWHPSFWQAPPLTPGAAIQRGGRVTLELSLGGIGGLTGGSIFEKAVGLSQAKMSTAAAL